MRLEIADTPVSPAELVARYAATRERLRGAARRSMEPLGGARPDAYKPRVPRHKPFEWSIQFNAGFPTRGVFGCIPWDCRGSNIATFDNIIFEVCRYFDIDRLELLSHRRASHVCYARHVAMYLGKSLTRHSLPALGRRFGGRDHTTVLHGIRKIEKLIQTDRQVAADVGAVLKVFEAPRW
jgi:hypothetical protein